MNYNVEAFQKIVGDSNIAIETLLYNSKEYVLFDNHPNTNNYAIGNIIKEHEDCNFKLGDLIYSYKAITMGNGYLFHGAYPESVKEYIIHKIKNKPKILNSKKCVNQ